MACACQALSSDPGQAVKKVLRPGDGLIVSKPLANAYKSVEAQKPRSAQCTKVSQGGRLMHLGRIEEGYQSPRWKLGKSREVRVE